LPEDTIHATPWSGWFIGDTKLPIFAGSNDSGLVLYSQLIAAFCNHYDSMGIDFSMTVMAEPNLEAHWSGTWDDANRLYEAFVNGVNASTGGTDIKVGGLVWAAGGQYSGVLDSIILWVQYWRNYCVDNDVRYDFICYHHYWRTPDRFDTVATAFEETFPGDEFWITEWNYKFSKFLPYDEYQRYVVGMAGATGNLDFLMRAQKHPLHSVLAHFCVVGAYKDYGICHWRDSANWDYTASGYMFRWLANFGDSELTIENASPAVSVLSAAGDNKIDAMLFNYDNSVDTVDFKIQMSDADSYYCEIWKMNDDSTVTSLFFIAHIDSSDSSIYWTDTTIFLPFPYLVEMDSNLAGDLNRIVPVDSNEIYYVKLIKNSPTQVSDAKSIPNSAAIIQTYPNPFNSSVAITANVGANGVRQTIEIFDINGKCVGAGLAPAQQQGDRKNRPYIWTPDKTISSGIYLVHASFQGQTIVKRIIYLK
ncbi:T9SS type A sorting domain-containing protein, partial [bacterium]|nr:T9SS type A sorting domain-containing protein [bacterium]